MLRKTKNKNNKIRFEKPPLLTEEQQAFYASFINRLERLDQFNRYLAINRYAFAITHISANIMKYMLLDQATVQELNEIQSQPTPEESKEEVNFYKFLEGFLNDNLTKSMANKTTADFIRDLRHKDVNSVSEQGTAFNTDETQLSNSKPYLAIIMPAFNGLLLYGLQKFWHPPTPISIQLPIRHGDVQPYINNFTTELAITQKNFNTNYGLGILWLSISVLMDCFKDYAKKDIELKDLYPFLMIQFFFILSSFYLSNRLNKDLKILHDIQTDIQHKNKSLKNFLEFNFPCSSVTSDKKTGLFLMKFAAKSLADGTYIDPFELKKLSVRVLKKYGFAIKTSDDRNMIFIYMSSTFDEDKREEIKQDLISDEIELQNKKISLNKRNNDALQKKNQSTESENNPQTVKQTDKESQEIRTDKQNQKENQPEDSEERTFKYDYHASDITFIEKIEPAKSDWRYWITAYKDDDYTDASSHIDNIYDAFKVITDISNIENILDISVDTNIELCFKSNVTSINCGGTQLEKREFFSILYNIFRENFYCHYEIKKLSLDVKFAYLTPDDIANYTTLFKQEKQQVVQDRKAEIVSETIIPSKKPITKIVQQQTIFSQTQLDNLELHLNAIKSMTDNYDIKLDWQQAAVCMLHLMRIYLMMSNRKILNTVEGQNPFYNSRTIIRHGLEIKTWYTFFLSHQSVVKMFRDLNEQIKQGISNSEITHLIFKIATQLSAVLEKQGYQKDLFFTPLSTIQETDPIITYTNLLNELADWRDPNQYYAILFVRTLLGEFKKDHIEDPDHVIHWQIGHEGVDQPFLEFIKQFKPEVLTLNCSLDEETLRIKNE